MNGDAVRLAASYQFHPVIFTSLKPADFQVKKNYEALRQREEEERMVQKSPPRGGEDPQTVSKWEKESHEATRELLKVKDRLIEVERNVSSTATRFRLHHFKGGLVEKASVSLPPRMPRCRPRRWR